ncbi:hypothetical protein [Streptomyces sp. H27-D2]|uniref:hypothetical protein n=1 Tax=Streptomyces sp. H27-D2 TaxID=3046304 RepID=UPI002DB60F72|nr:hypothetical protein [Streptomyces sp. H27-D2]MEC4015104.1 hypothetical protein [Streptomyces sp. H27-D2]
MSGSELLRLARIRADVTGETLEQALAALQGRPEPVAEPAEPDEEEGHEAASGS